jgi:hypothetical protein
LGVSLKDAKGELRKGEDVFSDVATAIAAIPNETERAGVASQIFGKSYAKLLPLFKQGPEGIAQIRKEFKELGGGFSPEFIKQAQQVNDDFDKLEVAFKSFATKALLPLIPEIKELSKELVTLFKTGDSGGGFLKSTLETVRGFVTFFNDLRLRPQEFEQNFVAAFGEVGRGALDVLDLLTGGWENFDRKLAAIAAGLALPFKVAWEQIKTSALITVAQIQDGFARMWNGILLDVQGVLTKIGAALSNVPGMKDVGSALVQTGAQLFGGLMPENATEEERMAALKRFAALQREGQAITDELNTRRGVLAPKAAQPAGPVVVEDVGTGRRVAAPSSTVTRAVVPTASERETAAFLDKMTTMFGSAAKASASVGSPVTNVNQTVNSRPTINVTVAPGTPEELGRRIGQAVSSDFDRKMGALLRTAHIHSVQRGG